MANLNKSNGFTGDTTTVNNLLQGVGLIVTKLGRTWLTDDDQGPAMDVAEVAQPHALVICRDLEHRSIANLICQNARVTHLTFEALSREMLETYRPDMVLSPVVSGKYDCLDVARWLSFAGYTGAFRIFGAFPKNPHVLLTELRGHCPTLDIRLMAQI